MEEKLSALTTEVLAIQRDLREVLSSRALECEEAMHVAFDEKRLAELALSALSVQHAHDSRLALGEQRLALECAATEALHAALEQQRSLLAEDKAEELALALSTLREELQAERCAHHNTHVFLAPVFVGVRTKARRARRLMSFDAVCQGARCGTHPKEGTTRCSQGGGAEDARGCELGGSRDAARRRDAGQGRRTDGAQVHPRG